MIGRPVPKPNTMGIIQFQLLGRVSVISIIVRKYTNLCGQNAIAKKIPRINDQSQLSLLSVSLSHLLMP